MENKKKAIANLPISVLKRNNKVEEGKTSSSGVKKDHESMEATTQNMMKSRVEPSTVLTMVWGMPTMVWVVRRHKKVYRLLECRWKEWR